MAARRANGPAELSLRDLRELAGDGDRQALDELFRRGFTGKNADAATAWLKYARAKAISDSRYFRDLEDMATKHEDRRVKMLWYEAARARGATHLLHSRWTERADSLAKFVYVHTLGDQAKRGNKKAEQELRDLLAQVDRDTFMTDVVQGMLVDVERHKKSKQASHRLGSKEAGEDVTQDAFLNTLRQPTRETQEGECEGERWGIVPVLQRDNGGEGFSRYLGKSVNNLVRNHRRRDRDKNNVSLDAQVVPRKPGKYANKVASSGRLRTLMDCVASKAPSAEDVLAAKEMSNLVLEELNGLSTKERGIIMGHYIGGLSFVEIARARGESPSTTKTVCRRAIEKLRRRLSLTPKGLSGRCRHAR